MTEPTFYLKADPKNDQRWMLLIREQDMPPPYFSGNANPSVYELEGILSRAIVEQRSRAAWIVGRHPACGGQAANTSSKPRCVVVKYRATASDAKRFGLKKNELLLGRAFTFSNRSDAALYKLRWHDDPSLVHM